LIRSCYMKKPFLHSIALCFSGGGYRAACFSLGTLSLFDHIGLLNNVKAISTVSGGTITGAKYAQSQVDKMSFGAFFKEYYDFLEDNKLASKAIKNLKDKSIWNKEENSHKKNNPINAFAVEYNELTCHRTLVDIENCIHKEETHLLRVVFNAADMTNGTQFRFQNSQGRKKWVFGNGNLSSEYRAFKSLVKLGDIIAASSAFPGGFEPMAYPHDFAAAPKKMKAIGLMDGGTIDNQGSSIFTMTKKSDHDLHFISDVTSPYILKPFSFSKNSAPIIMIRIFSSLPVLLLLILLSIFTLFEGSILAYTIFGSLTVLMLAFQLTLYFAYDMVKMKTGIQEPLRIAPSKLGIFMFDRAISLVKMSMDVFLKNDRRQHAKLIYSKYSKRTRTATIYSLRCDNDDNIPENENSWSLIHSHIGNIPSNISDVSSKSTDFGTTLWFTKEDVDDNVLDAVIACGEFTACYSLIAFLVTNHQEEIKDKTTEEHALYTVLLSSWKKFKKNPYYLVNSRKQFRQTELGG